MTFTGSHEVSVRRIEAELTMTPTIRSAITPGTQIRVDANRAPLFYNGWNMPITILSWVWQPDGGSAQSVCGTSIQCWVTPTASGTLTVTAMVNGEQQTKIHRVTVFSGTPRLVLTASRNSVDTAQAVLFTARAKPDTINGQAVVISSPKWKWRDTAEVIPVNCPDNGSVNPCDHVVAVPGIMTVSATLGGTQQKARAQVEVDSCRTGIPEYDSLTVRQGLRDALDSSLVLRPLGSNNVPKEFTFYIMKVDSVVSPGDTIKEWQFNINPLHPDATNCSAPTVVPGFVPPTRTLRGVGHPHPYRPRQSITCRDQQGNTAQRRAAYGAGERDWPALDTINKRLQNFQPPQPQIPMLIIDSVNVYRMPPGGNPGSERRGQNRIEWRKKKACGWRPY